MTSGKTAPKPIKVGVDLDGVILYNPIRIGRPLVTGFKKYILQKKKTTFTIPQTPLQKFIWKLLHKTSFFVAPGFTDLQRMVKNNQIEAYLITARFDFLKPDLDQWLTKINANKIFKEIYYNQKNEQPHLYKLRIIKSLNLDYFIEDNWDIVKNLVVAKGLKTKIIWIYNLFDRRIPYPHKHPVLLKALKEIRHEI